MFVSNSSVCLRCRISETLDNMPKHHWNINYRPATQRVQLSAQQVGAHAMLDGNRRPRRTASPVHVSNNEWPKTLEETTVHLMQTLELGTADGRDTMPYDREQAEPTVTLC